MDTRIDHHRGAADSADSLTGEVLLQQLVTLACDNGCMYISVLHCSCTQRSTVVFQFDKNSLCQIKVVVTFCD